MAQLFHRTTNWASRATLLVGIVIVGLSLGVLLNANRIYYFNRVNVPRDQPVPFSHKHHVTGMGLDCWYCHTIVEESSFAGIPPTETCMTCHSQLFADQAILEPVRSSFRDNTPLQWTRVHDLPDFAYFNHSIHIDKGVGCQTCHGQVDQMQLTWVENALNMEWCLECHRQPEKFVRPRAQVFNMNWKPPVPQEVLGRQLVEEYDIQTSQLTDCSTCHR